MSEKEAQIKALKPFQFKPGQSGNPMGRARIPEELKVHGRIGKDEFNFYFAKYAKMKVSDIEIIASDKETTGMDAIMASAFSHAISGKSSNLFSVLLDKAVPRPKDGADINMQVVQLSDDDLYQKSKEIIIAMARERGELITIEGEVSSNMK